MLSTPPTPLTHRELDALLEQHRKGAMLFGSKEHDAFVVAAIEMVPRLVAAVRATIPGELLVEVRIAGFSPRGTMNSRDAHWGARQKRVKKEHEVVSLVLASKARKLRNKGAGVGSVTIVRLNPTRLDSDNCVASLKGVRDSVAKWLGVDDGDERITWAVEQRKVSRREAGTVIQIREATEEMRAGWVGILTGEKA